ncbi:hypothetical protein BT63DRAFT_201233 [Microthyrium microscopicum]|uniref:Uncharacterized protein n=1 Tax=Microthyrium microscopicum TaxID=703497 RepID=A0A6A6UIS9_9PEZI|nr:hypothetical protein BT63DRAFT_201233 [Microthyrium microscopicum]
MSLPIPVFASLPARYYKTECSPSINLTRWHIQLTLQVSLKMQLESLIAIVTLVVTCPPSILVIWKVIQRRVGSSATPIAPPTYTTRALRADQFTQQDQASRSTHWVYVERTVTGHFNFAPQPDLTSTPNPQGQAFNLEELV